MAGLSSLIDSILLASLKGLTIQELRRALKVAGYPHLTEAQLERHLKDLDHYIHLGRGRYHLRGHEPISDESLPADEADVVLPATIGKLAQLQAGYVVFDIETTGTHIGIDRPIQIAALKVIASQPAAMFFSWVHPEGREIPYHLRQLLDVPVGSERETELLGAPHFPEVMTSLKAFIGDLPTVAHNGVLFDAPFLRHWDMSFEPEPFDTVELSALAFPKADHWRLADLVDEDAVRTRLVSIVGDQTIDFHDARFDCVATFVLMEEAVHALREASSEMKSVLGFLLPELSPILGEEVATAHDIATALVSPTLEQEITPVSPFTSTVEGIVHGFRAYLSRGGLSLREGQLRMVRCVAEALNRPEFVVAEAPTGTGKSLALAFPAAVFALDRGERIAISTRTKNLQKQLVEDLEVLRSNGVPVAYQIVRGRDNYACLTAFEARIDASSNASLLTRFLLAAISARLTATREDPNECGCLGSLEHSWLATRFGARFHSIVNSIRSRSGQCSDGACRSYGGCYVGFIRRKAAAVQLLVVNHSLWLQGRATLPDVYGLLFDEAHTLEDAATEAATIETSSQSLNALLLELISPDNQGLLPWLRSEGAKAGQVPLGTLMGVARAARIQMEVFAEQLEQFLKRCGVNLDEDYPAVFRLKTDLRRQEPARYKILIEAIAQLLDVYLRPLSSGLHAAAASLQNREPRYKAVAEDAASRLDAQIAQLDRLCTPVGVNVVRWILFQHPDTLGEKRFWAIREAPVSVSAMLQETYDSVPAAVLTSATLTTDRNDFTYLLDRLGLAERIQPSNRHVIPGDFPYDQALLIIPRYLENIPTPARMPFFVREVAQELSYLFGFTQGHAMALFTSRNRMEEVYKVTAPLLARQGIQLLAQGLPESAEALVHELQDNPNTTSILGLGRLWEGIDIPGPALSILVIEKLRFAPLTDPVVQARREVVVASGRNDFFDYLLPSALIQFKQGFGRLIRGPDDRGVVLFLDRRLHHKSYKPAVLGCLPGYSQEIGCEDTRTGTYRAIARHLPRLFEGRDVETLLAQFPTDPVSRVAELIASWRLDHSLTSDEYEARRNSLLVLTAQLFGFSSFRSREQEEIIRNILCGRDVIGILPTGSGKSLTFQLPALVRNGLTVVVSPLISLMRDQIDRLHGLGIEVADALYSGQSPDEREDTIQRIVEGRLRMLYCSPERLREPRLRRALVEANIDHLVVDEAHCVSLWGASFRPEYLGVRNALPSPTIQVAALTATATPQIESDIRTRLQMVNPVVVRATADRPEIWFGVFNARTLGWPMRRWSDKFHALTALAKIADRDRSSMIVYTATTVNAEEVSRKLSALGYDARFYHGKMAAEERADAQELFMEDVVNIMVATKAFGMGIDKPDIRYVIHFDMPGDLESYYQEAGRAGRDGQPAYALMLFHERDVRTQEFFLGTSLVRRERLQELAQTVMQWIGRDRPLLFKDLHLPDWEDHEILLGLYCLEQCGFLVRTPDVCASASLLTYVDRVTAVGLLRGATARTSHVASEVLDAIAPTPYQRVNVDMVLLAARLDYSVEEVDQCLQELASAEALRYRPWERGPILKAGVSCDIHAVQVPADVAGYERNRRNKLDAMLSYARNSTGCRRHMILEYLGEDHGDSCGSCDVCNPELELPWSNLRRRDVPNPAEFFDPSFVILQAVDENLARSLQDGKAPYGRSTLKHILTGNEYMALRGETDRFLMDWRRRRLRSFPQWGLLSSLRSKDNEIDTRLNALIRRGLLQEIRQMTDNGFEYIYLDFGPSGRQALERGQA